MPQLVLLTSGVRGSPPTTQVQVWTNGSSIRPGRSWLESLWALIVAVYTCTILAKPANIWLVFLCVTAAAVVRNICAEWEETRWTRCSVWWVWTSFVPVVKLRWSRTGRRGLSWCGGRSQGKFSVIWVKDPTGLEAPPFLGAMGEISGSGRSKKKKNQIKLHNCLFKKKTWMFSFPTDIFNGKKTNKDNIEEQKKRIK